MSVVMASTLVLSTGCDHTLPATSISTLQPADGASPEREAPHGATERPSAEQHPVRRRGFATDGHASRTRHRRSADPDRDTISLTRKARRFTGGV